MQILQNLFKQISLETLYIIFSVLVTADVFTGMMKAWKFSNFKSRTLRDGLFGSMGELIVLALCILAANLLPFSRFIVFSLLIYMSVKELYSVVENLIKIGVKFPTWLVKGLQVFIDHNNDLEFSKNIKGENENGKL